MKLYRLGILPKFDSMLIFPALAYLGQEGFVLVSPQEPIVTLGYFQDYKTGVDMEFCRNKHIGVLRREVGGGTTLLDSNQIFFQIVLHKSNPAAQGDFLSLYRKFSQPVIDTYNELGVKVRFKEVNDLLTLESGRKITGEGGANIGDCVVFVGGILLDFDHDTMSRVFPAQNEEFRSQLLQSLQNNVTSLKRELESVPSREEVENCLLKNFEKMFGVFELAPLTEKIWQKKTELEALYTSEEFLQSQRREVKAVKIASGVNVVEKRHKAVGGSIHTITEIKDDRLNKVSIFGDFTFLPKEKLAALELFLQGVSLEREKVYQAVASFMDNHEINCPGVGPEDFTSAILHD